MLVSICSKRTDSKMSQQQLKKNTSTVMTNAKRVVLV